VDILITGRIKWRFLKLSKEDSTKRFACDAMPEILPEQKDAESAAIPDLE
jgi:hypothetical protein